MVFHWRTDRNLLIFWGTTVRSNPIELRVCVQNWNAVNLACAFMYVPDHGLLELAITLMYRNRLHAWWSTQSRLATLLSSLFARRWVGLQILWRSRLKDWSIDEIVVAWYFGCCQAHGGLLVGFLLLRYSVLFTVESLSLLNLPFYISIYMF